MIHTKLAADSVTARIIIGMLSTTAILYAWVTPLIVSALEQSPNISAEAAGFVFSANMYGTATGGLLAIAMARTLPWRLSCMLLVLGIASLDFTSIWIQDPTFLAMVRFGHGLMGGMLMGFSAVLITRAGRPERTISIGLGLQTLLGGAMLVGLAPLIDAFGAYPIWVCMIIVAVITLIGLPFLGDYPDPTWIGGAAALFTAYWSTRSGYVLPMIVGGLLSALSVALLAYPSEFTYFAACVGLTFFFTITIVYLLAMFSVLDPTGRFATVGSFINTLGLATGPLLAATLLTVGFDYVNLAWFGALGMVLACGIMMSPARFVERYQPP